MPALWLEPGKAAVAMTLDDGQVAVGAGPLHGHYHMYRDKAQGEKHLIIVYGDEIKQQVLCMKHVGGNVYRANTKSEILVFQNEDKNVTEPEFQDLDDEMLSRIPIPDFQCVMSFIYMHPDSPEATLRLGYDKNGDFKVSWQGKTPTGWWSANELKDGGRLPSGIDAASPVFAVRFNHKGEETQESGTVYGLLVGTSHVYRAIGSVDENRQVRLYDDDDIGICTRWHIVLVSKVKPSFV